MPDNEQSACINRSAPPLTDKWAAGRLWAELENVQVYIYIVRADALVIYACDSRIYRVSDQTSDTS